MKMLTKWCVYQEETTSIKLNDKRMLEAFFLNRKETKMVLFWRIQAMHKKKKKMYKVCKGKDDILT